MRPFLLLLLSLGLVRPLSAQTWPTTEWHVVEEGVFVADINPIPDEVNILGWAYPYAVVPGTGLLEVDPPRDRIARHHEAELSDVSAWLKRLGFRAPPMERHASGAYQGRLKNDDESIVSSTNGNPATELFMRLSSKPEIVAPSTPTDRLMARSGAHELFHAVAWAYPRYGAFARANSTLLPDCGPGGTDRDEAGWLVEGAASALQIRLIERQEGRPYRYHLDDPSRAAWMRYYDQPLHRPRLQPIKFDPARREAEFEQGRSWKCGYGTWYFWHAAGEMLGDDLDEKVQYLRYILDSGGSVEDGGLGYIDQGLRDAARALGSSSRYDEGLYEIYPRFIAEYANDWQYYENAATIDLEGDREIQWASGDIEPLAARAWQVRVDVPDYMGDGVSIPLRVTLANPENRDQIRLIEGENITRYPREPEDPYQFTIPIRRDTTLLVRLVNVAPEAAETEERSFSVLFDLGGFYGVPNPGGLRPGSATLEDLAGTDIPPGFAVMDGPPDLLGCVGAAGAGSVFDLITAAEASGDIRRTFDNAEDDLDEMLEAIEAGEFPIPMGNVPASQRRAMMERMMRENPEMMAEMRAALADAQAQVAEARRTDGAEAMEDVEADYRGRSRLIMTLVGEAEGKTCQILIQATLRGEEGGAQQLSVADSETEAPDGPSAIGIGTVGYLVGTVQEHMQDENPYEVCMMTAAEQARARGSYCPVVCTSGQLALNEASEGHAKGMLSVEMIRPRPGSEDAAGCPVVDRRSLTVHFNITSANQGQDAEVMRGVSDETLRAMGIDQDAIDVMRRITSGNGIIR